MHPVQVKRVMGQIRVWRWWSWTCVRLSPGVRRPSLYSFPRSFPEQIHFLSVVHDAIQHTGNNMSLFFPSVTPSRRSLSLLSCVLLYFEFFLTLHFISPPTTYDNAPVRQLSQVFLYFFCSSPSDSPLLPNFIWSHHCSFELDENASLQKRSGDVAGCHHVWWQERHFMHVCVWSDFNLTPVKSPQEIAGSMNAPLPSSVSASLMNYLSPQSIDAFSCILHPSRDSFICAVIIEGGRRYDMKAKVQLLPSLSPSVGASGCSISGRSRGVGKVSPSHFDAGARCW